MKSATITVSVSGGVAYTTIPLTTKLLFAVSKNKGRFIVGICPTSQDVWAFYVTQTSGQGITETIDAEYYYL